MFFLVVVASARISNLFLSGEGKSWERLSRGSGAGGTGGTRVARLTGAARPRGLKKDGVPGGGSPRLCPVWTEASRVRVGASPCLAPGLCGSEVQLSLFSVLRGRPGSCFFYFWKIGLTQHRKKVIKRSRSFSIT